MTWLAEILIDDDVVWSSQTAVSQQEITIDVSSYIGLHTLKFRLRRIA